ncbi:MAG: MFS transporter, partial [Ignavibacteriae bacterium]|nr:MFS transporter [Ignavibacteriota bacterium]
MGIGGGFFLSTNNKLVMHYAPAEKQGIVSSTLQTFSNLGSIMGIKLLETIYTSFDKMHTGIDITSYQYTYIIGGFITLIACILSFGASFEGYKVKTDKFHYKHLISWH